MDAEDWNAVELNAGLEPGMIIIFTRKRANKLWLTAFSGYGNLTTNAHFNGATLLIRIQPPLPPVERVSSFISFTSTYLNYYLTIVVTCEFFLTLNRFFNCFKDDERMIHVCH